MISADSAVSGPELVEEKRPPLRAQAPGSHPFTPSEALQFSDDQPGFSFEHSLDVLAEPAATDDILQRSLSNAAEQVRRFPTSARALTNLGLALLNLGRASEAETHLERALDLDENFYPAVAGLARAWTMQGRLEAAEDLYRRIAELRPTDPGPLINLASLSSERGGGTGYETAAGLLQTAIALAPNEVAPRLHLALVLMALGRLREAVSHLREATRIDVRSAAAQHALGVAYSLLGDVRRAARAFRTALVLAPGMAEAARGLATMLLRQKRHDEAIGVLKMHVAGDHADYQSHTLLAYALAERGSHAEARAHFEAALRALPSGADATPQTVNERASLLNNIGVAERRLNNHYRAALAFYRSIEAAPNFSPIPYLNVARVLLSADRHEEADPYLRECERRFPNAGEAQTLLAISAIQRDKYDRAFAILQDAVQLGIADVTGEAVYSGLLVDELGQFMLAVQSIKRALERHPGEPMLINSLAYAHLMRGDVEAGRGALAMLPEDAKTTATERVLLTATRGLLLLREGDEKGGTALYHEAAQIARANGMTGFAESVRQKLHAEAARALAERGRINEAMDEVRRGLRLKQRSEQRRQLIRLGASLRQLQTRPSGLRTN
jgi:tetratricopeptide (TPR) repeat protein